MELTVGGENPKSILIEAFFTRRTKVALPPYIRAPHPKTGILPEPPSIKRILEQGWVAQTKIHGHRAQLHIPAEGRGIVAYNRQGKKHALPLAPKIVDEILRLFRPDQGWNVIDAEWLKPEEKIYVFDFLKQNGELLNKLTFPERWEKLPRSYISPHLKTLPLVKDLKSCMEVLASADPIIEGLVFKSLTRPGFSDTSIIRCRKRPG